MSEFLSVIEWFDETGDQLVQRIPEEGSGALKLGSMVTVRENQAAVFFRDGKGLDVLGSGRHILTTVNIPVLTRLLSLPWGFTSPFRAEVVFVNQKLFTDLGWGTQQPIAYRDEELGLIRLRAHGNYAFRVKEPLLFVNRLVGTQGAFRTEHVRDYLRDLMVSRITNYFGEQVRTLLDLPARYTEMSETLLAELRDSFLRYGLELENFFITAITPPDEVQRAIDQRSEMAAIGDLNEFLKYQAAQALGRAGSGADGGAEGTGAGVAGNAMAMGTGAGLGLMLPGMIWESLRGREGVPGVPPAPPAAGAAAEPDAGPAGVATETVVGCPSCHSPVAADSRFCHHCGEALVAGGRCGECDHRLPPDARFCSNCGADMQASATVSCAACKAELPEGSRFCSECGERIAGE